MIFAGFALAVLLVMKWLPDLPVSRTLHHLLVEAPLALLARFDRRHVIFVGVIAALSFTGMEMIMLFGSAEMFMLYAWDVTLVVDALIATWTLSTVARGKAAWRAFAGLVAAPFRKLARPRTTRTRPEASRKAANDADEDGGAWAYARAA
ncbi:MAG TPA: hypothetical protein VMG08_07385 [Allosphingosinicella sp.]|nr:hypothetical protein [Allosphingosinicella sp.]